MKETMERRASDNRYLHKDFHGALSNGLDYIASRYGEAGVDEYLRNFTAAYYSPLTEALKTRGLIALKEHLEAVYNTEGGRVQIDLPGDELLLTVDACPAVTHMREHGYTVSRHFAKTTTTVNEALCKGTPYAFELIEYDEPTGRSTQRFYTRSA